MKKFFIATLILLCLGFVSACNREDTTQLAKDEFAKYNNGKNDVVLFDVNGLYFQDYTLEDLENSDPHRTGFFLFYENTIYHPHVVSTGIFNEHREAIEIYSCDLHGKNSKLVFSKKMDVYGTFKIRTQGDSFYFQYTKDDLVFIDRYTIPTNTYENLCSGKDCRISDHIQQEESQYSIEMTDYLFSKEHDKFVITDSETGAKRIIDNDYLKNTIYFESINMFGYGPDRFDISKGHILLTYEIEAGDGWDDCFLVFEYDFEKDALEYKLLAFTDDRSSVEIHYTK